VFVSVLRTRYTEEEARFAIAASFSWAESLRRLGLCTTGGAWRVLKTHAADWGVDTSHFLPNGRSPRSRRTLEELLVEHSPVRGTKLKNRLYAAGLKAPICELCGQGELWEGRPMALILDHINGVRDDNRIANLRVVCANCNATLDTHCGRNARVPREPRECLRCAARFIPRQQDQQYCSSFCGSRHTNRRAPKRKTPLPPLEDLLAGVETVGYEAVGRTYGVSGTSIRTWVSAHGVVPPPGRGRDRNPPPSPPPALGDEEAGQALDLLAAGASMYAVAQMLGVTRDTIRNLRRGITYRHLERPCGLPLSA